MKEIWKDIYFVENGITYDYRGLYQVSNLGNIKSLKYGKEKILKPRKSHNGYLFVCLFKNKKRKNLRVHRLVGFMFIPNNDNKPEVNHDDGNKENCCVSNLYWATRSENQKHAYEHNLQKAKKGSENKQSKRVLQYDLEGNLIKIWDCVREIERKLNIPNTNICDCCKGKRKTAGGYIWRYY